MTTISIIIPVYKVEQYLSRCLDSVKAQSFTDWECILVDDGSPDNSGSICDEYVAKDPRFKVIHKQNGGPGAARNTGIDNAFGKYILFVDSDDWVGPEHVKNLYDAIVETRSSIVFQGLTYTDGIKQKAEVVNSEETYDFTELPRMFEKHKLAHNGYSVCKLYDADIIRVNDVRYPIEIRFGEDMIFTLRVISYSKRFAFISATDYYYYFIPDSGSLSHTKNPFEREYDCYREFVNAFEAINNKGNFSEKDFGSTFLWASAYALRGITSMYAKGNTKRSFRTRYSSLKSIRQRDISLLLQYHETPRFEKTVYSLLKRRLYLVTDIVIKVFLKILKS